MNDVCKALLFNNLIRALIGITQLSSMGKIKSLWKSGIPSRPGFVASSHLQAVACPVVIIYVSWYNDEPFYFMVDNCRYGRERQL